MSEVVDALEQLGHGQALLSPLGFGEIWVCSRRSGFCGNCEMMSVRVMPGMCWNCEEFLVIDWGWHAVTMESFLSVMTVGLGL